MSDSWDGGRCYLDPRSKHVDAVLLDLLCTNSINDDKLAHFICLLAILLFVPS